MQEGKTHLVVFFSPIMHALQSPVRTVYVIVMSIYKKNRGEKEERNGLIDRETIPVILLCLSFEQQHNIGINRFSRPSISCSLISQGWTFAASKKYIDGREWEEKKSEEGHDNLSKDISWIIDKCTMGKLH